MNINYNQSLWCAHCGSPFTQQHGMFHRYCPDCVFKLKITLAEIPVKVIKKLVKWEDPAPSYDIAESADINFRILTEIENETFFSYIHRLPDKIVTLYYAKDKPIYVEAMVEIDTNKILKYL